MKKVVTINGRKIGKYFPVYVIAELSANHNKNFDQAVELVKTAKKVGADAVKLQTYTPDTLTIPSDNASFCIKGQIPWDGQTLYDLYKDAYMPWEWQPKLKIIAFDLGMDLFSSAFDSSAVSFLEAMGVPAYKIASPEIVDLPLIEKMALTGKPLFISVGMASLLEIKEAVQVASKAGAKEIILLKCTSSYPAPATDMNLRTIPDLSKEFGVPVGLSDHTLGSTMPTIAVALGACVIEKHLTLSRNVKGPDSAFSMEPEEFKCMVDSIRIAESSLGKVYYGASKSELTSLRFRRSLFVIKDMQKGDIFTEDNIRSIRPANGLPPKCLKEVLGHKAALDINKGTPLQWKLVQ
jgi:pseudaminic acid synthase